MKKEVLNSLSEKFNVPKIVEISGVLSDRYYAIRSNDPSEDSTFTNAGKFETQLFVKGAEVKKVISSFKTDCFIQEMIIPEYSFVYIKTVKEEILQLNNGLCYGITSGLLTGVSYLKSRDFKPFGTQKEAFVENLKRVVSEKQKWGSIELILEECHKVGQELNFKTFNIEGSVKDNKIYILQARNINSSPY